MKLNYKLEVQYNNQQLDIASLESCISNYLTANKYTKKNTNVYLNLSENVAYVVETKKDVTTKSESISFDDLLKDYAEVEKAPVAKPALKKAKLPTTAENKKAAQTK